MLNDAVILNHIIYHSSLLSMKHKCTFQEHMLGIYVIGKNVYTPPEGMWLKKNMMNSNGSGIVHATLLLYMYRHS